MARKRTLAAGIALMLSLAACGGDDSGDGDGGSADTGSGDPWILGTTDTVSSLDPAGSYDLGSSTLHYAIYQTLLTIPGGANEPEGDAAESCEYEDPQTFTCTLQEGLTFSNGNELTSSDVKFSLERNIAIADPNGASVLLSSIANEEDDGSLTVQPDAIETPDDQTITFHLNSPDTTFQFVLTHSSTSILDEETFPRDSLLPDDQIVSSGPYAIDTYEDGQRALLVANEEYQGSRMPETEQVQVNYYKETSNLKLGIEQGDVQVAWRSLSPTEITDLQDNPDVEVIEGDGAEIRYWVWHLGNQTADQLAVRQAVAQVIDRDAIAQRAYDGTVDPLYSMVPPGFPGQVNAFEEKYGQPDVDAAEQLLNDAGIQTPVQLTVGYTPTHYGPNAVDEANEVKRQLDGTGLFNVTLESAEWEQYQDLYQQGAYDMFMLGWFPDFLDADNYLSPFFVNGGFFSNQYRNEEFNQLVAEEQGTDDDAQREEIFREMQQIVAEDVPAMPSWVGRNTAAVQPGVEGVENTLDPAFIFRIWTVSYNG